MHVTLQPILAKHTATRQEQSIQTHRHPLRHHEDKLGNIPGRSSPSNSQGNLLRHQVEIHFAHFLREVTTCVQDLSISTAQHVAISATKKVTAPACPQADRAGSLLRLAEQQGCAPPSGPQRLPVHPTSDFVRGKLSISRRDRLTVSIVLKGSSRARFPWPQGCSP